MLLKLLNSTANKALQLTSKSGAALAFGSTELNRYVYKQMKKALITILVLLPITSYAKCDGLVEYLINEFPNRVFVENFGFNDSYAVYEPSLKKEASSVSVIKCVNGNFKTEKTFNFKVKRIDHLTFSEKNNRMYVSFVDETEQYGWIESINNNYKFTMFSDPEL